MLEKSIYLDNYARMENETGYRVSDNDFKNISDEIDDVLKKDGCGTPVQIIQILQEANSVLTRELPHGDRRQAQMSTISSVDEFRSHKEMLPVWYTPSVLREAINSIGQRCGDAGISFPRKKASFKIVPKNVDEKVPQHQPELQEVDA